MNKRIFSNLVLAAAHLLALSCASAQDLSGQWIVKEFGYTVTAEQKGDAVRFIADEEHRVRGYDTVRPGDVLTWGTFNGSTVEGSDLFFNHDSAVAKCGLPRRGTAQISLELSADGYTLQGAETAMDLTNDGTCRLVQKSSPITMTRVSFGTANGCPQLVPIQGREVSSADVGKHYRKYIASMLSAEAQVTFKQVTKRAGYGYEMFKVLQDQFSILQANAVPALINDKLPLLSAAVKQKQGSQLLTDTARALFRSRDPNDRLANAAMCVAPSADNDLLYELNLYGVDKAACTSLKNNVIDPVKTVRVNGPGGTCEPDILAVDWKPWQRAGRNQVTLVINPWATGLR